jgi:AraC-like DNA-binding protein
MVNNQVRGHRPFGNLVMDTLFDIWPISEPSNLQWFLGEPIPHRHPFHQVFLITEGGGTHSVDGVERRVQAPWLMLLAKGKTHLYLPNIEARGWIIDFGEEFLDEDATWLFSHFVAFSDLPLANDDLFDQACSLARIIWDIGKIKTDESRPALRHLLSAFLHLFQARIREQATWNQPHRASDLQLFQSFLRQLDLSFATEKEVEFYSRQLRCTPRRLCAACKLVLGRTPQHIIAERCMLEAKRLLLHTDLSIQQIASGLGCEDQSNFTKAFRKATGETPSGFRKSRILIQSSSTKAP